MEVKLMFKVLVRQWLGYDGIWVVWFFLIKSLVFFELNVSDVESQCYVFGIVFVIFYV